MTEKQIDDLITDYTSLGFNFCVDTIKELRQQRDDARREVCVYEAIERNRGKMVQTDDIAEERGWQYLYDDKESVSSPIVLTPQPISTAPKIFNPTPSSPIMVWSQKDGWISVW